MNASACRGLATATLTLLGLISAATLPVRAQGADDIYAKAKTEGAFVLYVGGPTAPWEATARIFEQRYPGIKVAITGGFSNVLDKKIDQQIKDNKLEVDTAIFQTLQDFVRWKAEGQLLPYKPPGFDAIDQSFKDADGAFYGVMVNAMSYMYNSEHVAAADVPNAAPDFLKPQFKGRMITPYPADDDATLWLFHKIVLKYGWDYMDKYMANKPNFIQGHLGQQRSIAFGAELGDVRFDLQHHRGGEEGGQAGRFAFLERRCDADLAAHRRDLQERAASERGEAVPRLAAGAGAAGSDRHLVVAQGRAAAQGVQADLRLPRGQRLPQLSRERGAARRAAQALRGLYRAGGERRRGAVARSFGCARPPRYVLRTR
jgi:extracellular solute-binding protein